MNKVWWSMSLGWVILAMGWAVHPSRAINDNAGRMPQELTWEENEQMSSTRWGMCRWCGLSCIRAEMDLNCVMLAPPEGKSCVFKDNKCTIVSDDGSEPIVKPSGIVRKPTVGVEPTIRPGCISRWWIDNDSIECKQKEFCGLYNYQGLRLFETKEQCDKELALRERCNKCEGKVRIKGDANCDEKVDMGDFADWKISYTRSKKNLASAGVAQSIKGDFNCDNRISLDDFWIWRGEFIKSRLLNK